MTRKSCNKKSCSTYAVSLYFDDVASEKIAVAVRALSEVTGNAWLVEHSVPTHLTLGMFHADDERLPLLKEKFSRFAAQIPRSVTLSFGETDTFSDKVIFRSVKKSANLKKLNERLHTLLSDFEAGGNRNYLPENWFPHIALSVKLNREQFDRALEKTGGQFGALTDRLGIALPDSAKCVSVALARCHPYEEIARVALPSDSLSAEQRHKNMSHIRSTGGKLETTLRSQLFRFGFRFRKNDRRLAGSPDIVFPHYKAVIFVNGCFWHAHGWKSEMSLIESAVLDESVLYSLRCEKFRMPGTNPEFWLAKFTRNRERDLRDIAVLLEQGWRVGVVWECSITGRGRREKIRSVAEKISLWLEEEYSVLFREF